MVMGPDFVRDMKRGEEDAVDALLCAAFGNDVMACKLRKLRKSGAIAGESVLAWQGDIIGYFALSYMMQPKGWLCLAPVAIHPDWQRKRHGKRMIGLLGEWARISQTTVITLGGDDDSNVGTFYQSAGFSTLTRPGDASVLGAPHHHAGPAGPHNVLIFPTAFAPR